MNSLLIRLTQWITLAVLAVTVLFITGGIFGEKTAHALPEFAERTGEPCSTCHVSPGGGGPRTLRGLLWAAKGRPDEVPKLGNILMAPGVTSGIELYDLACAACHGTSGEGLFGAALVSSGLGENKIEAAILRGRERSGMPSFEGQLTAEQIEALVAYVAGISSGELEPAPLSYPLPPAQFECTENEPGEGCGGN